MPRAATSGSTTRRPPTAVAEICETVDGLPLGIELAAARMAAMSAVEVRDRLADRFRLLQGAAPGPERQLTLRHAVEWSYDLLTDDERALLRTASVFAGGFDLTSIVRRRRPDADDVDVLRHLDSLVRKSLVVADHSAATTRYSLFETIRQFAEDRLADAARSSDRRATRTRRYFAARGRRGVGRWNGPGWRARGRLGRGSSSATCGPGYRWSVERGRSRGRHRHRRARRADGLLGAAVRDARLGRGAARGGDGGRRAPAPPALHRGRLRLLRRAAETGRGATRTGPPSWSATSATTPCEPGYSAFIEALGAGLLRRPRPLRRAHR